MPIVDSDFLANPKLLFIKIIEMRTRIKSIAKPNNNVMLPYINSKNEDQIKLIDFKKYQEYYMLQLNVKNIDVKNYRLFIKGRCLSVVVSEIHRYPKPAYVHDFSWSNFDRESYEVFKSVDVWLPGENFYLIRHFVYPYDELLELMLGINNQA